MREARRLLAELISRPDIRPLMNGLKRFDGATYRHCLRVGRFAIVLARVDGMADEHLRELAVAAMLHDLGKTEVSTDVLRKPGPLDADERAEVRRHPAAAVGVLRLLEAFPNAHRIAPLHHETQGDHSYPRSGRERRSAREQPSSDRRRTGPDWVVRAGRILALADRYDALISRRTYKEPWPDPEVRAILDKEMPDVAALLAGLRPPGFAPR